MADFTASFRTIPDTRAAVWRAGPHTIVIDRPEGRAGGSDETWRSNAGMLSATKGGQPASSS